MYKSLKYHCSVLGPNSIKPTFTESSPQDKLRTQTVTNHQIMKFRWKSPTQIMKVADKPSRHVKMFATKFVTPLKCPHYYSCYHSFCEKKTVKIFVNDDVLYLSSVDLQF